MAEKREAPDVTSFTDGRTRIIVMHDQALVKSLGPQLLEQLRAWTEGITTVVSAPPATEVVGERSGPAFAPIYEDDGA